MSDAKRIFDTVRKGVEERLEETRRRLREEIVRIRDRILQELEKS